MYEGRDPSVDIAARGCAAGAEGTASRRALVVHVSSMPSLTIATESNVDCVFALFSCHQEADGFRVHTSNSAPRGEHLHPSPAAWIPSPESDSICRASSCVRISLPFAAVRPGARCLSGSRVSSLGCAAFRGTGQGIGSVILSFSFKAPCSPRWLHQKPLKSQFPPIIQDGY